MTKVLLLVADGMGDWPLEELDGKTPLEAAYTPNMDGMATKSRVGLCQTIPAEMPAGSDIANMTLLGYDPARYHTGRGPIEAVAMDLQIGEEDLVWRCNLVELSGLTPSGRMLDYAGGHIDTREAAGLIQALQAKLQNQEFSLYPGVQYRHLMVQRQGARTKAAELDITPPHDLLDQEIGRDIEAYRAYPPLWEIVREAARVLEGESRGTNTKYIWPWGQGKALRLPSFLEKFSLQGSVISAVDLVKGLGRAAGLRVVDVPGATGLLDTNYQGKFQAAGRSLQEGDFVLLHLEGPDECGHMGAIQDKMEAIARFDREIVGPLLQHLRGEDFVMVVCCDHLTPIKLRTHARDPIPFMIYDSQGESPGPRAFSEKEAAGTSLFLEHGFEILPLALKRARL